MNEPKPPETAFRHYKWLVLALIICVIALYWTVCALIGVYANRSGQAVAFMDAMIHEQFDEAYKQLSSESQKQLGPKDDFFPLAARAFVRQVKQKFIASEDRQYKGRSHEISIRFLGRAKKFYLPRGTTETEITLFCVNPKQNLIQLVDELAGWYFGGAGDSQKNLLLTVILKREEGHWKIDDCLIKGSSISLSNGNIVDTLGNELTIDELVRLEKIAHAKKKVKLSKACEELLFSRLTNWNREINDSMRRLLAVWRAEHNPSTMVLESLLERFGRVSGE